MHFWSVKGVYFFLNVNLLNCFLGCLTVIYLLELVFSTSAVGEIFFGIVADIAVGGEECVGPSQHLDKALSQFGGRSELFGYSLE